MCTALTLETGNHYFGRNLDLEYSYQETVTITPRNYPLIFRHSPPQHHHYAMIGMAYIQQDYPLYYDATNEMGLSMAGLNFPENACYFSLHPAQNNVASFELIPWVLGQCKDLSQAWQLISGLNICNTWFQPSLPPSPLHWLLSDREHSLTLESTAAGLHIYENSAGILTNNPPFDFQMTNLANYMALSPRQPDNHLSALTPLPHFSRGMGGLGLPGDLSSPSRFVRAAFFKANSLCHQGELESVGQFFHILDSVSHPRGSVEVHPGAYEITVYSCCCNTDTGVYYYKSYDNSQITAVDMHRENLNTAALISYPLEKQQQIRMQNDTPMDRKNSR